MAQLPIILLGFGLCCLTSPALATKSRTPLKALTLERLPVERIPGERVHVYIDKDIAKSDTYPVFQMKARDIYAGQLLSMNDSELFDYLGSEYTIKETKFADYVFNVVRAGSEEEPFFQLLGGHNRIDRGLMLDPDLTVNVRVLVDVSHFPEEEQEKLLAIYGHFWSPENPEGKYDKRKIHHIMPSPWRSLVKIKKIKSLFEDELDERLVFPEIEFGRRLYNHLKKIGFHDFELQTTAQVAGALLSTLKCEKHLKARSKKSKFE